MTGRDERVDAQVASLLAAAAHRMVDEMVGAAESVARFPADRQPVQPVLFDLLANVLAQLALGLSGGNHGVALDVVENVTEHALDILRETEADARQKAASTSEEAAQ